ncbi:MAG: mobilome CxxCx(11)CxxC protein [Bacteroidia bacterium]|jgi:mobilome CxxCx(11)CxxC protein
MENEEEILRNDAWNKAIHSFGKAYIFSKRARFYNRWIRFVTILGVVVPVMIGATASGYGFNSEILKHTINISIPLTIIQLIISIFALVNNWSDYLSYSLEATNDYGNLSEAFKKMGKNPPNEIKYLKHQLELLETKYSLRGDQDSKYGLNERELRKGMRYALREFQRKCIGCDKIPLSNEPTDCGVCGNFKRNIIQKLLFHG